MVERRNCFLAEGAALPVWRKGSFWLRLAASYCIVPLLCPLLLFVIAGGPWVRTNLGEWISLMGFFGMFALGAMIVLGTPLLIFYLWRGWTGFLAFSDWGRDLRGHCRSE